MKILCSALTILLLFSTGCLSVKKQPRLEDPRAINSTYNGTKRIDVFETLIYQSFAYDNRAYFKSMVYSGEPQVVADGQNKPLMITPHGKMTKFESICLTKMHPNYSFPYLPKNTELLGVMEAKYPNTGNSRQTVGWPIAAIDGSIFIVKPIYTE